MSALERSPSRRSLVSSVPLSSTSMNSRSQPHSASNDCSMRGPGPQSEVNEL